MSIIIVMTVDTTMSKSVLAPKTFSAFSLSPLPKYIDALGAPPKPASAAKAAIIVMSERQTPTPVNASSPIPSICPMYILSTRLYSRFINCAATAGSASLASSFPIFSFFKADDAVLSINLPFAFMLFIVKWLYNIT